jgi:hypothetical protein
MLYHVTFQAFETITGSDVPGLRQHVGSWLHRALETGKVVSHGVFVGKRGGYALLNADSNEDLFGLIGDLVDSCTITVDPLISSDTLGEFFRNHPFSGS